MVKTRYPKNLNGYQFGIKDIYNPWNVLKCVKDMVIDSKALPKAYWINISGNDIVKKLIEKTDDKIRNEIELLIISAK